MKNTKKILFLLILLSIGFPAFTQQQNYFYGYKTKYLIKTDSLHAVVLPKQNVTSPITLLKRVNYQKLDGIHNRKEILVELPHTAALRTASTSDYDILPVFEYQGFPLIPTGEIVLKPKQGISFDQINTYCKGNLRFVKQTLYGTITIKPTLLNNLLKVANTIFESGLVEWCEPDFIIEIVKHQTITPTDPLYNQQYYLNQANNIDINAPQAWGVSRGLSTVRVAVIDDGVEAHEDLNGRVVPGFTPTNVNGLGAPTNSPPPLVEGIIGHGQACAGIIGATHDNVGISGILPCSQIVPVNIFNSWYLDVNYPQGQRLRWVETAQDLAAGINWAWDPNFGNAHVLSNSWGYNTTNANNIPQSGQIIQAITDARTLGRGGLGSVVVFASGNSHQGFSGVTFPANVTGVITVGAIDRNGNIWNYSSRGAEMDLVAPTGNVNGNGDVVTTDRMANFGYVNGNYTTTFGGTSAACPQVAGVAALMLSTNTNLTEAQVKTILQQTATDMGSSGFDNTFGFGRLNALAAVNAVVQTITGPSLICNSGDTFILNNAPAGSTVSWQAIPANIFTTASGSGTTASLVLANPSGPGTSCLIQFTITTSCGSRLVQKGFDVGIPSEPIIVGPPGNPVIVAPNNTVSFNVLDIAPIYWDFEGNPAHYSYSLSSGNFQCSFTPTQTGNFKVKARYNYGCGFSGYDTINIVCRINKPDLTIQSMSAMPTSGSVINVNLVLANIGYLPATTPVINYYRSTNSTYDIGDTYLGNSTVSTLSAQSSTSVSKTLTLSGTGSYIIAYADPSNVISEISEANNTAARILIEMQRSTTANMNVYPMPFSDELTIALETDDDATQTLVDKNGAREVQLVDIISGKTLYTITTGDKNHTIDTRQIPAGKYVLRIRGSELKTLLVFKQ